MKSDISNADFEEAEELRWQLENAVTSRRAGRVRASAELQKAAHRLLAIGNSFQAGMAHLVLLQYDKADHCFREAQADFDIPEWDSSWWIANNAFLAGRYYVSAKLYCDYALKVNPDNTDAYRLAANSLVWCNEGSRYENHLKAIEMLKKAAELDEEGTLDWAKSMLFLGEAFRMYRVHQNKTPRDLLVLSSEAYKKGLDVLSSLEMWEKWAEEAPHYAAVMSLLDPPGRRDNTRAVLQLVEKAAEKITATDCPESWSLLRLNTGALYTRLPDSKDLPLTRRAIACYREALEARKGYENTDTWALANWNIADSMADLPEFSRGVVLAAVIEHTEAALRYWTLEREPLRYATCNKFLGDTRNKAKKPLKTATEWYDDAYSSYEDALRVYSLNVRQDEFVECHLSMTLLLQKHRIERFPNRPDQIVQAKLHCDKVLEACADDQKSATFRQAVSLKRSLDRRWIW